MSLLLMRFEHLSPKFKKLQYFWFFIFFATSGSVSGYFTARLYKLYNGSSWLCASLTASAVLPLYFYLSFALVEYVEYLERSSSVMPKYLITGLVLISCCFNFLFVSIGSYIGFKSGKISLPVKTARVPRI